MCTIMRSVVDADAARYLAAGAGMLFMGRAMLCGIATHGEDGVTHAIDLILAELNQIISQLYSPQSSTLSRHLIKPKI
jgi:hypothetical protein